MLYPPEQINVDLLREARQQRSRDEIISAQHLHEMEKNKSNRPLRIVRRMLASLLAAVLTLRG